MTPHEELMDLLSTVGRCFAAGLRLMLSLVAFLFVVFVMAILFFAGPYEHSVGGWCCTIIATFSLLSIIGAAAEAGDLLP